MEYVAKVYAIMLESDIDNIHSVSFFIGSKNLTVRGFANVAGPAVKGTEIKYVKDVRNLLGGEPLNDQWKRFQ